MSWDFAIFWVAKHSAKLSAKVWKSKSFSLDISLMSFITKFTTEVLSLLRRAKKVL